MRKTRYRTNEYSGGGGKATVGAYSAWWRQLGWDGCCCGVVAVITCVGLVTIVRDSSLNNETNFTVSFSGKP